jgi:hypothetical protein
VVLEREKSDHRYFRDMLMARDVPTIVSHYNISEQLHSLLPGHDVRVKEMLSAYMWSRTTLTIVKAQLELNGLSSVNPAEIAAQVRQRRSFRFVAGMRLRVGARLLLPQLRALNTERGTLAGDRAEETQELAFLSTVYVVDKVEYVSADGNETREIKVFQAV